MDTIYGYESGWGYTYNSSGNIIDSLDFGIDHLKKVLKNKAKIKKKRRVRFPKQQQKQMKSQTPIIKDNQLPQLAKNTIKPQSKIST